VEDRQVDERAILGCDRIERLWPKSPSKVSPDTTVAVVLKKMVDERIGCVMVVDNEKLVGIFSERDALMKINTDAPRLLTKPISQFMTSSPVTLETSDKIAYALHKMNVGGYRHMPILFQGKLAGVISIRDILRYLAERIAAVERIERLRIEAHEQLVLGPETCWIGDCMRRDPAKCDAYESYVEGCGEAAGCAAVSFERLWLASQPLVSQAAPRLGGMGRGGPVPIIEASPQPTAGTRH